MGKNITIMSRQNDVSTFYRQSSVVLNLSDKNRFIETFGMTALEAMTAGLPVIVPTEGGIAEMVKDGVNGYKIDVQRLDSIADCLRNMLSDRALYRELADNAFGSSKQFCEVEMINQIETILERK